MPDQPSPRSRRDFLQELSLASFAAAAASCGAAPPEPVSRPPNILFLLTDDQRWDMLGSMGNPIIKTPNLDRLAGEGMSFVNNFVTTSICAVSRASFFTGLYARCHGIHGFQTQFSEEQHAYSYPVRLREEAGYRTGFIGKYGLGGDPPGERFDYFKAFAGQGRYLQEIDGKTVHLTEIMGDQALEFLDGSNAEQPWNLSISFKAPHVQDNVAPYFINDPK